MKPWYNSKTIQYAILSGIALVVTSFATQYPEIGYFGVANTVITMILRWYTTEQLSTHSWGIAIDIEPVKYPLGTHDRLPKRVVDIFKRHGFVCGEDFPTSDPGHMQLASGY
jgi:hypothetical protein